jgi:hypothetical protein
MYAVHYGDKAGSFFVYIKECNKGNALAVLMMPSPMEAIYVSSTEIQFDIKNNNIRFVTVLHKDVYEVCRANFEYYTKKGETNAR